MLEESYLNIDRLRRLLYSLSGYVPYICRQNTQTFDAKFYRTRQLPFDFHINTVREMTICSVF